MIKSHLEWLRMYIIYDLDMAKIRVSGQNFVAFSIWKRFIGDFLFLPMNGKPCSLLVSHDGHV